MLNRLTRRTCLAALLLWLPLVFGIATHSTASTPGRAESSAGTATQMMPRGNLNDFYSSYTFDVNFDYDQHQLDAIEQVHFTNTYTQSISQIVFNVPPAHDPNQFILNSIQIDQAPAMFNLKSGVLTVNLPVELEPYTAITLTLDFSLNIPPLANVQSFASANLAYTAEATNIGYWYPILA
ncbi:MAG TPA: hypothetical protein VFK30_13795, partial [Anaerolineae bacterium]|nr:hypothetical protein [Anaerolineae bacterium]